MRAFLIAMPIVAFSNCVEACDIQWIDLGPTPFSPEYIPQGLSSNDDGIILSVYSDDHLPHVRFFGFERGWQEFSGVTEPLRHTSGIIPYQDLFFLVDYETGYIARATFEGFNFSIDAIFDSNQPSISSGFILSTGETEYLSISTFGLFGSILYYQIDPLLEGDGGNISPNFTHSADSFIQGNYSHEGLFAQSRNRIGRDIIEVGFGPMRRRIDFDVQLPFPGSMIEDITVLNGEIYTTDEYTFRMYRSSNFSDCLP